MRVGLAAESASDVRVLRTLLMRLVSERRGDRAPHLECLGPGGTDWLDVHRAHRAARDHGMRRYGHFNGEPAAADAMLFYSVLWLFAEETCPPQAVVVARDLDKLPERKRGFEQAINAGNWPFSVLPALADPELEAWLIAAWSPEDDQERAALRQVRQELGFDPTQQPQQLSSGRPEHKRDAKRVLAALCRGGRDVREHWETAPIDRMLERGVECGLAGFILSLMDTLERPGEASS